MTVGAPVREVVPTGRERPPGLTEAVVGAALVALALLGALVLRVHPAPGALDQWLFDRVQAAPRSAVLVHITEIHSPVGLVVATVLSALVATGRDRRTALACLVGPALVVVGVELVLKPAVNRRFGGVPSYPSGNVADVAAVATAWLVAVPRLWRLPVAAVGAALVVSMGVAVIGLRWHYPTDAIGGALFGTGVVLALDGMLHLGTGPRRGS